MEGFIVYRFVRESSQLSDMALSSQGGHHKQVLYDGRWYHVRGILYHLVLQIHDQIWVHVLVLLLSWRVLLVSMVSMRAMENHMLMYLFFTWVVLSGILWVLAFSWEYLIHSQIFFPLHGCFALCMRSFRWYLRIVFPYFCDQKYQKSRWEVKLAQSSLRSSMYYF